MGLRPGLAAVRSRRSLVGWAESARLSLPCCPTARPQKSFHILRTNPLPTSHYVVEPRQMVIAMTTEPRTAKDIFVELVGNVPPDQWDKPARSCLRRRSTSCGIAFAPCSAHTPTQAASWTNPRQRAIHRAPRAAHRRAPRHGHRPVQAAAADRRRRHGRRLHGRADRADPADGRAEDHQARHGHAAGDRPLRGRAAGPGDDGPSEHRQSAGCRRSRSGEPTGRESDDPIKPLARLLLAGPTSSWSW